MNKLQIGIMFLCAVCLSSCSSLSKQDNILTSQKYKWYSDRIVQGNYTGKALSGTALESNYQSPVVWPRETERLLPGNVLFLILENGGLRPRKATGKWQIPV